jgi:hypothetical protein
LSIKTGPEIEQKVSNCCKHAPHLLYSGFGLSSPSLILCVVKAAEQTAAAARAVAEDNNRAAPVLISGATGCYANSMNGLFAPTKERSSSGRVVYRKCCDAHMCIEHINGQWQIKPDQDLGRSALQGSVVGGCALEACIDRVWRVGDGNLKWQDQPTLKIAIGANVERQVIDALLSHPPSPLMLPYSSLIFQLSLRLLIVWPRPRFALQRTMLELPPCSSAVPRAVLLAVSTVFMCPRRKSPRMVPTSTASAEMPVRVLNASGGVGQ